MNPLSGRPGDAPGNQGQPEPPPQVLNIPERAVFQSKVKIHMDPPFHPWPSPLVTWASVDKPLNTGLLVPSTQHWEENARCRGDPGQARVC